MITPEDVGDMWGMSIAFWELVFRWATIAAFVSGGLTVTAAFVSIWVGYQLTTVVQQEADRRIAEFQAEAARANEAAAAAQERAAAEFARLREQAEKANAEADASIAGMTAELAEARKQTAVFEKDASQARLELLKLKAQLAWRTISPPEASALRTYLSATPSTINIEYVHGDTESQYFAHQIANVFVDAKWNVGLLGVVHDGYLVFGVVVPDTQTPDMAAVRKAFNVAGIAFVERDLPQTARIHGTRMDTAAAIFVGSKPIPRVENQPGR